MVRVFLAHVNRSGAAAGGAEQHAERGDHPTEAGAAASSQRRGPQR